MDHSVISDIRSDSHVGEFVITLVELVAINVCQCHDNYNLIAGEEAVVVVACVEDLSVLLDFVLVVVWLRTWSACLVIVLRWKYVY